MDANIIFQKTALGLHEVGARAMKLAPKVRTMLILIDGHLPASTLKEKAALIGAPDDFLEQLVKVGLIADVGLTLGTHSASTQTA